MGFLYSYKSSNKHDIELSKVKNLSMLALNGASIDVLSVILENVDFLSGPVQVLGIVEIDDVLGQGEVLEGEHGLLG